jgi:hypothetical protein
VTYSHGLSLVVYCNFCGHPSIILETHHVLDEKKIRTGEVYRVCKACHVAEHSRNMDYREFGRRGGLSTKKKGLLYLTHFKKM